MSSMKIVFSLMILATAIIAIITGIVVWCKEGLPVIVVVMASIEGILGIILLILIIMMIWEDL